MRASLFGITVFLLLANGTFCLHAQTNSGTSAPPSNPQATRENRMISFLTPAEQDQYAKARAKALADSPGLKTEGENVAKQGINALTADATAADKQAFMEKMNSHRQKLRQAMLKEDPNLEPIFAEIDKHISEMKAQHLDSMQGSASPSNAPPSGSASH